MVQLTVSLHFLHWTALALDSSELDLVVGVAALNCISLLFDPHVLWQWELSGGVLTSCSRLAVH